MSVLSRRGPYANQPAKLPGIQAERISDGPTREAIAALREWVEVRLGARGDKFERAVTERDLQPRLDALKTELLARIAEVEGSITEATAAPAAAPAPAPSAGLLLRVVELEQAVALLRADLQALAGAPAPQPQESLTLLPPPLPDTPAGLVLSTTP